MGNEPKIVMIAAVAENGVIGREGDMPWRLPSDLKYFRANTLGRPVIMGRKTFQSIGKPLPGRLNIVVTRSPASIEGAEMVHSVPDAIERGKVLARASGADAVVVIGGGEIYRQAMVLADELLITHVEADVSGDTLFPPIDPAVWERVSDRHAPATEADSHDMRFAIYRRKGPAIGEL